LENRLKPGAERCQNDLADNQGKLIGCLFFG